MRKTIAGLSNIRLLERVRDLVICGNEVEAELLAHLAEVDARQLYLEEGCSAMFAWCQRVLHFAEGVAYKRIQAARAVRRHPEVLEAVRRGELHLTAVGLLAPKLTAMNCAEMIKAARHRSADEVRRLLADREPKPVAPSFVRRLPESMKAIAPAALPAPDPAASPRAQTESLGAGRYRVQFTADRDTHAQIEELRSLMRHQIPDGDVGKIMAKAVAVLLREVRKQKFAETSRPTAPVSSQQTPSRHIPAVIRRAVWQRDAGCCTYVSKKTGRRCGSRDFVEFDHVEAWSRTRAHSIEGIALRCRAHNLLRARDDFGRAHMAQFGRSAGYESGSA